MKEEMYEHIQEVEQSHWWYVARRKIIFDWVLHVLADYANPRILDIGCGTGFNIEYLQNHGYPAVMGLDFSSEGIRFCQSRELTALVCGDGRHPPFANESFDVVMALDLIEHIADDVGALQECAKLLKPNGSLIIFTPAFNFLWGLQDEVSHHYRRYTGGELKRKLLQVNLEIQKLTYANTFLFPMIWAGRTALRWRGNKIEGVSENDLHPGWSNGLLQTIFASERLFLRYMNFPFGVSLFCVAKKQNSLSVN